MLVELLKKNQTIPRDALNNDAFYLNVGAQRTAPEPATCQVNTAENSNGQQRQSSDATSTPSRGASMESCLTATSSSCITATPPVYEPSSTSLETEEELQEVLETYRRTLFPYFPVVWLGPEVTVEYMAANRPMLWLILRAICSRKLSRQFMLVAQAKFLISKSVVVEGERSFDTLCALILYANWGQFFCMKANLSPCIQLAIGLAGDLGLTKPAPQTSPAVMLNWTKRGCPKPPQALVPKLRTMEERRVVLGLFLVSSICANFFQRAEPMRWTSYLEECLQLIAEAKEYPSDELLTMLVRIQIIANSIEDEGWTEVYPISGKSQRMPRHYFSHIYKMQLDDLKRSIPSHLADNLTLKFHLLGLEVTVHEQRLDLSPITSDLDSMQCKEGLWSCFAAVKAYVEAMFDSPGFTPFNFLYISVGIYGQLGHCLVALFRLSTFEGHNVHWDRRRVIAELDLADVVRKLVYMYEAAPIAAGIDTTDAGDAETQWDHGKKIMLTTVLKWWETKVRPSIVGFPGQSKESIICCADNFGGPANGADLDSMDFNFETESWFKDIIDSGFDFGPF
ncbi:hypothetical protein, variant [Verruconis gallopava]|nr:hypothetical protein, variant [Verruconis gallopava]KIW02541.1 hypothetical protein, variant [Verruconis gallopava]